MKVLGKLFVTGIVTFAILQTVRPSIPTHPATAELQVPPAIHRILEKGCYSCHSDERRLSWFDQIVPGYWLVRHDVLTAREHLNFSTLGAQPAAAQRASLFEAVNMIQLGAMPIPQFSRLHPEATTTPEELQMLKDYLVPWPALALPDPQGPPSATVPTPFDQVKPEWNGVAFDPSFKSWKPVSTTDRGDNNTFRLILGNEVAVKAAQSGNITPWPDGARLAKIAWQQQLGADGLVHPGKFLQVEFMIKDARAYKATEGWGWGRWRGLDLKPYGKDASFVNECTTCHLPVHGDDYVYTLPLTQAKIAGNEIVNNHAAALPAGLPFQPLGWSAVTMYVDRKAHTTSTLYANHAAETFLAGQASTAANPLPSTLPAGAVLALVTWVQREDPHWFGGRIPDSPASVEFVQRTPSTDQNSYISYAGADLAKAMPSALISAQRLNFVLGLKPAQLP